MNRIDKPYHGQDLNEKTDPAERFSQILDEANILPDLHELLSQHYPNSLKTNHFLVDAVASALEPVPEHASIDDQLFKFLNFWTPSIFSAVRQSIVELNQDDRGGVTTDCTPKNENEADQSDQVVATHNEPKDEEILEFFRYVASTHLTSSSIRLWSLMQNSNVLYYRAFSSILITWFNFVQAIYGPTYFLSRQVFSEKNLRDVVCRSKEDAPWFVVDSILKSDIENREDLQTHCDDGIASVMIDAVCECAFEKIGYRLRAGEITNAAAKLDLIIPFIQEWMISQEIMALERSEFKERSPIYQLKDALSKISEKADKQRKNLLNQAQDRLEEIEFKLIISVIKEVKPKEWDERKKKNCIRNFRDCIQESTKFDENKPKIEIYYEELLSSATSELVEWFVDEHLVLLETGLYYQDLIFVSKLYKNENFREIWERRFREFFSDVNRFIKIEKGPWKIDSRSSITELYELYNESARTHLKSPGTPKKYVPELFGKLGMLTDDEDYPRYLDMSIGVLRGRLLNTDINRIDEVDLTKIAGFLQSQAMFFPKQAIKNRYLLLRDWKDPLANESLSPCCFPLNEHWFCSTLFFYQILCSGEDIPTTEEPKTYFLEIYKNAASCLAEFCLSRLRLKKGEKPVSGKYRDEQVTEPSPKWRQAYLKVLIELGLNPSGKVHKAAYFIRDSDPDEAVREIAKECYRAARKASKKEKSVQDFKRSIIASEWWLLMVQRQALGHEINYEEALKTRRRMLRNP